MKIYKLISCSLVAFLIISCERESGIQPVDPIETESEFTLDIEMSDGARGLNKIYSLPKMSFLIKTDNSDHSYTIEYSIDGGKKQNISPILPNTKFNLDYEFYALTEYGSHIVSGKVYDNNSPSVKTDFEKKIWIKYLTGTTTDAYLVTHLGNKIEGNLIAPTNNDGLLCFDYTPVETIVLCTVESSDPSVIEFYEEDIVCENGTWQVPYHTSEKQGAAVIKMHYVNGDEENNVVFGVATSSEKEETNIEAELNVQPFVIEGYNPFASVKVKSGPSTCTYNVDFYIDDILVKKKTGIALGAEISEAFVPVLAGEHVMRVEVEGTIGYNNSVTLSSTFIVAPVTVSIGASGDTDGAEDKVVFGFKTPNSITLFAHNDYNVTLYGVPIEYLSLFDLTCDKGSLNEITRNPNGWTISLTDLGEGYLTLSLIDHPDIKCVFKETQYEYIELSIEKGDPRDANNRWKVSAISSYEKRISDIAFRVCIEYYGVATYPKTDYDGSYLGNEHVEMPHVIIDKIVLFKANESSSVVLENLSDVANDIESQSLGFEYYSDEGRGYIERNYEEAPYRFKCDTFNVGIYFYDQNAEIEANRMADFTKYHIVTINGLDGIDVTVHQSTSSN